MLPADLLRVALARVSWHSPTRPARQQPAGTPLSGAAAETEACSSSTCWNKKDNMNIVLLDPGEANADGEVTLLGDRARHLLSVLKVKPGGQVRSGVLDGPQGLATIIAITRDSVSMRCVFDQPSPPPGQDTLL